MSSRRVVHSEPATPVAAGNAKRARFRVAALLLAALLCVAIGELGLRAVGQAPFRPAPLPDVPIMQEPDPLLGWRNKAGRYRFDASPPIAMTFWPGGLRATAPERRPRDSQVLVLGGSFTQGWAVSDAETWAYRVQHAFPEHELLNLGTAGYGVYQSLLALEQHLAHAATAPRLVIFGFNDFHSARDVATPGWLHMLSRVSHLGAVATPYATLAPDGRIERHPPLAHPQWPGRRWLASIALLEERSFRLRGRGRAAQATAVTQALLLKMDATARGAGARLLVAVLSDFDPAAHAHFLAFLEQRGVAAVDCPYPDDGSRTLIVPGYGHPNATVNEHWAGCIGRALGRYTRGR